MLTKIDSWKLENFLSNRRCFSLKKHVFHCLFSRLFEHDFNSTGTSTSPKRSVNGLNAMLNVLLFSSHYTAHTPKNRTHMHTVHTISSFVPLPGVLQLLCEIKEKSTTTTTPNWKHSRYDASDFTAQTQACILNCMLQDGT